MKLRLDISMKLAAILIFSMVAKGEGVRDIKKYNNFFSNGFNTPASIELAAGQTALFKTRTKEVKGGIQLYRNKVFNVLGGVKHASSRGKVRTSDTEFKMQMTGPDLEVFLFPESKLYGGLSVAQLQGAIIADEYDSKLCQTKFEYRSL